MKRTLTVFAALCVTAFAAVPCSSKSVTLQSVDLNDKGWSTEGGEATLYRVSTSKKVHCRIEVIHYGEGGKTIYGFAFNPHLFSAVRREYEYEQPIYVNPTVKQTLVRTDSLRTKQGSATLPAAFREYRSIFDTQRLRTCLRP